MPETPNYGRYTEIPYDQMSPAQQEGYRALTETRVPLGGPRKIWVENPKMAKAIGPIGAHFHPGGYSLSEREREIAVIIINSKWHSAYPTAAHERRGKEMGLPAATVEALLSGLPASFADEREREIAVIIINSKWHSAYPTAAHERRGKEQGLPADKVEAMLAGLTTSFADAREQVVYEMATCLANSRWVPKGLFDRAVKALGHVGITDVITLMGYYTSVSLTLAFYDVPAGAQGIAR